MPLDRCFLLHKTDQVFRLEVGKLKGPLAKPLSKKCRYDGLSVIDRPGGKRTFLTQEIAELLNNEFHLGLRCVHRRYAAFLGQALREGASARVMRRTLSAGDEDGHTSAHGQTSHREERYAIAATSGQTPPQ